MVQFGSGKLIANSRANICSGIFFGGGATKILTGLFFILLLSSCHNQTIREECLSRIYVKKSDTYKISIYSGSTLRTLKPSFFGFNLEWIPFQLSLWDQSRGTVKKDIAGYLRAFPGAVYRYPGGTVANNFDWHEAIGDSNSRPLKKYADWLLPIQVEFGLDEYLSFVKYVNGEAWYVANLHGYLDGEMPSSGMSKSVGEVAAYLSEKHKQGFPAIKRWELGNELDRGEYLWTPKKLGSVAESIKDEIVNHDHNARFVTFLQDYPAMLKAGFNMADYNGLIIRRANKYSSEYAHHLYYDGPPNSPPVASRLEMVCDEIGKAESNGIPLKSIWLTEHARAPEGAWLTSDWKKLWPKTSNFTAAIGVADMMIATAQLPEISGSFVHALHGTDGPWPLFYRSKSGGLRPTPVMASLRLLRESMLPNVLFSSTESNNQSDYEGGYDMRAVVMSDEQRVRYSAWAINRASKPVEVVVGINALSNKKLTGQHRWITSETLRVGNVQGEAQTGIVSEDVNLDFDPSGNVSVILPPYSISTYSLAIN